MIRSIRALAMRTFIAFPVMAALVALSATAEAALTFTVGGSWPNEAHRTAAVNAMQAVVDRYNAYGNFGNYNVYVYYNAGIPTAQASYLGSIGFGGTYPNERVTMHELAHYLGSGTYGSPWDGPRGEALVDQFDGLEAQLQGDAIHFWPYGLNYDSEGSEINKQRQVAMIYAQRADMGLGPTAHPSTATTVTLTASDPYGESGFNYKTRWSDGYFAHAGAAYSTGAYVMRTPESSNSFTFAGDSLTLSNPAVDTGLYFRGLGTTGIMTFNNLILDGGWVDHRSSNNLADLFQLDGTVTVNSPSTIRAYNGNINILAEVTGGGDLTIPITNHPRENNRYVRFLSSNNSFVGDIINESRFELTDSANFRFMIGASGVNNAITGAAALKTLLNGVFEFDLTGASSSPGDSWALVTAANATYGPNFSVAGFTESNDVWSNGAYAFSQATGLLAPVTAWAVDGGGMWSHADNWSGGVPTAGGDATLGSVLTAPNAPATVSLDVPVTLNRLTFDNSNRYVVAGANSLTLGGDALLVVNSGSHEIAVPVGGTAGLNVSGSGSVTLAAANSYSGDTNINAGTLALKGTATIANSPNINVHPGATFDVAGLSNTFELASGQSLNNNSNTTVFGDVIATNGSIVTGSGTFNNHLTLQSGATLRIGGVGLPIGSAPVLIDNFDSYDNSVNQNIGAHGNGDVTGSKWGGVFDGTNNGQIVDNYSNPSDNELVAFGVPSQGSGGWRGAVTDLADNFSSDFSLADGDTATYFFQVMNEGNAYTDTMIGLTENLGSLDINNAWQDFSVMPYVVGAPGATSLNVHGDNGTGGLVATMIDGQWRNVWLVVDNASKTFDIYTSTGTDAGVLALTEVEFGRITDPVNLEALGITNREDGRVRIDSIYMTPGENTANPLAAGGGILYSPEVLSVVGDVWLQAGATVTFDIATSGTNDQLDVSGNLEVAGTLQVLLDGSAPALQLGDTFDILDFGSASGAFEAFDLPGLSSGLMWNTSDLLSAGILEVIAAGLVGDYNNDGAVDAADYTVWRDAFGQDGSILLNRDPANAGLIGEADYSSWKTNFGMTIGSGAGNATSAAVPEPCTSLLALLMVSGAALLLRPRYARQ